MFDIAWSEFLIVAVVALVVVGPKDLPGLLRNVGRMIGQVRRMAGDFQSQFSEALREAELDGLKREMDDVKNSASKLMSGSDPFKIASDELKGAIGYKPLDMTPSPSALVPPAEGADAPAADTPSAFAPPPPELPAPHLPTIDEPPPVSAADFPPHPSPETVSAHDADRDADRPPNPARRDQPGAAT